MINPNTVAKAYRELEHEGVIELRHGAGAFVSAQARGRKKATDTRARRPGRSSPAPSRQLRARGVTDEEIRRLFEAELAGLTRRQEGIVADAFVIETADLRKTLRRRRSRARADPAGARRIDLRISRQERRRQDHHDQGAARHGAADERQRPRLRPAGRRAGVERRDPPPHRLRQRRQGPLRLHDRGAR